MVMFGFLMKVLTLFHIQQVVIGYYPTMDGHGYPITNGDGHLSITVVGITIIIMAGFGFPIMNGVLHG